MAGYQSGPPSYPHPSMHPGNGGGVPQEHHSNGNPNNSLHDTLAQQNHSLPHSYSYPPQHQPYLDHSSGQQHDDLQQQQHQSDQQAGVGADGQPKGNRLRKACDSCSIRKVKCDESGPPCRACTALDIPCTFERPSRRRGPPNRHAEAIKKRRLESPTDPIAYTPTSPHNVAATLASFSSHAVLSADSICPFSTLELLVDDFFTYIHPLVPFPHEPSFRAAFKHREDLNNPSFLALLASMIGTLVASFPRKPRIHLKNQQRENLFPNALSLVERCHKVAISARGSGYLDKELTVYDAATSYFLALSGAYTINWRQCRLYLGETLTIVRTIGAHKTKDPNYYSVGDLNTVMGHDGPGFEGQQGEPIDYIRQEIGRRLFWVTFAGVRSMQQVGATFYELYMPPSTPSNPYPPMPLEVDDEYIYVSHVDPQPEGIVSRMCGFNLNVQVYTSCNPIATIEMAYGTDEVFDWNRQRRVLEECLRSVKKVFENAPSPLVLRPSPIPGQFELMDEGRYYYPPAQNFPGARSLGNEVKDSMLNDSDPERRRWLQYEIQKANVYASQLGTRSYIVEKYWNLLDAYNRMRAARSSSQTPSNDGSSPGMLSHNLDGVAPKMMSTDRASAERIDMVEIQMSAERENIVKDLLAVLGSISQVNMEPNGGSFIGKIRQIASTLLDTPRNRKGPLALKAEEYLARFLDVLMKLERLGPTVQRMSADGSTVRTAEDEDEEQLRNWADLREYQTRFAQSGAFMSDMM